MQLSAPDSNVALGAQESEIEVQSYVTIVAPKSPLQFTHVKDWLPYGFP